jgi:hypothetical protein
MAPGDVDIWKEGSRIDFKARIEPRVKMDRVNGTPVMVL